MIFDVMTIIYNNSSIRIYQKYTYYCTLYLTSQTTNNILLPSSLKKKRNRKRNVKKNPEGGLEKKYGSEIPPDDFNAYFQDKTAINKEEIIY